MKSYTDIEQSKRLSETLPIKSADGFYEAQLNPITDEWEYILFTGNEWASEEVVIPCWSLTALLNVLPISIDEGQHCLALINSNPNGDIEWLCGYEDYKGNLMTACYGDNQIDACMEMILKLKEYNLL